MAYVYTSKKQEANKIFDLLQDASGHPSSLFIEEDGQRKIYRVQNNEIGNDRLTEILCDNGLAHLVRR